MTVILFLLLFQLSHDKFITPIILPSPILEVTIVPQTKTANCLIQNNLPDKNCTPGAIFPAATKDQICAPGYSKSVRNVSVTTKNQVYAEYEILSRQPYEYEVDHLISLELGGSNDIANLWPEPAEPKPGYHEKDEVENYLHEQICNGSISLQLAQQEIASNWLNVYKRIPNRQKYDFNSRKK
jgi:hypothetical protein